MALRQTRYDIPPGESVQIATPPETLDFLLNASTRRIEVAGSDAVQLVAGPNQARDQMMLAAPARTEPGEYTATLSAVSATGEQRAVQMTVVVRPRQTVPAGSTRPPVVLLNGWQTGFTGACTVSSSSSVTFGNLAQYLVSDGVPVVYFFDNCVEAPDATVEVLGNDLGTFLKTIKYADGTQVPQIDLVAFSLGGLIARSYLAGMQTGGTFTPPVTTLVRKLILIATPNFGSFVLGNYINTVTSDPQSAELIPGSSFLWNLATWNQRGDDLRGVDALAIVGNAGVYLSSLSANTQLNNASDGLVSVTSASAGFALPTAPPAQVVTYCHIDPSAFTNTLFGTFNCSGTGIANVTSTSHQTGAIVRSFLAGTTDWKSIGVAAAKDPNLSIYGGVFFAMQNTSGSFVTDLTGVTWGTVPLTAGADTNTVYYTDFVNGSGDYQAVSTSLGTVNCGTLTEALGYFSAARCKMNTAIFSVAPLASTAGRVVTSGGTITITGYDFGDLCSGCQVLATPVGSSTQTALQVSSWTNTAIAAALPASMTGFVTIEVKASPGTDAINIMAVAGTASPAIAAAPASLQFAYSTGGTAPAAQTIQITNSGSGTLAWTATKSQSWLSISPASGTAPSTLTVSVSPAGLAAGSYSDTIQIAATGASNTPVSIAVSLTIGASTASLSATPKAMTFNYTVGGAAPAAQSINVANTGAGTLSWTASTGVFWASVSPASGNAPGSASVTVNPANLAAGTYTGNVQITAPGASGSPTSVTLTLVVQGNQPAGNITAVANAGSFQSNFASATWVSIFGTDLSASTEIWQASDFVNGTLPTSLDGVSVTINGVPAYIYYISPTQINALAPDDATTGAVQVQVTAAQKSNSFTAQKQQFSPAFFTIDNGAYLAARHLDGTLVGKANLLAGVTSQPAAPGETVELFATGLGPTNPPLPTAQLITTPEQLANSIQVTIGGAAATVGFAGLVEPGLYQLNVTVPASLPSGDQAVLATIGGLQTQANLPITVQ